jgi:hypothetical protein
MLGRFFWRRGRHPIRVRLWRRNLGGGRGNRVVRLGRVGGRLAHFGHDHGRDQAQECAAYDHA